MTGEEQQPKKPEDEQEPSPEPEAPAPTPPSPGVEGAPEPAPEEAPEVAPAKAAPTAPKDDVPEPVAAAAEPPEDGGPSLSDLGPSAVVAERAQQTTPVRPVAPPVRHEEEIPDEPAAPEEPVYPNTIFAVKTSIGHERIVADAIENKAMRKGAELFAILCPQPMRGYIFIEACNPDALQELLKGVKKVRGIVRGEGGRIPMEQIEHFLAPKPLVSGIVEGNIVELIAGPFKGEKARVQQIDEAKEEITVELFEAMISIPITVRGDHVRVIEKEMK
jgi:transcriptional antiterminator NusG